MANLVDIYNMGTIPRMIKFIESEVAKACGSFTFQQVSEETFFRMQEETRRAMILSQMMYGVPSGTLEAILIIDDGTRTVYRNL